MERRYPIRRRKPPKRLIVHIDENDDTMKYDTIRISTEEYIKILNESKKPNNDNAQIPRQHKIPGTTLE